MKSPDHLSSLLCRQWNNADLRERRLLDPDAWPLELPIGQPTPSQVREHTALVHEHIQQWRAVSVGNVQWQAIAYRSVTAPVMLPSHWHIRDANEWALAIGEKSTHSNLTRKEMRRLLQLLSRAAPGFHRLLVRQRSLWRDKDDDTVITATRLALELEPGIAAGAPLRTLALCGIDSKFIERNATLLTALLDARFDGAASAQGLDTFLGASGGGEHWLLVVPLSPGLLPFAQLRIRASELRHSPLPASHILLIENERCLHHLPSMSDTIAVLGFGANVAWLHADWLQQRRLGYWGDMDTWGLQLLARARRLQPHLQALLMEQTLFDRHAAALAVPEPVPADVNLSPELTPPELAFHQHLSRLEKGRIEQEFLPVETVTRVLLDWHRQCASRPHDDG